MKLYHYDSKHEQVIKGVDLGGLTGTEIRLVQKVLAAVDELGVTDGRYSNLRLANGWRYEQDEDGESEIRFY
jgi:hypothetical protein